MTDTINRWRGDAQGRAQVTRLTLDTIAAGYQITITCNRKDVVAVATSDSVATAYGVIATAIANARALYAEFLDFSASVEMTAGVATAVLITGPTDGKPFEISVSTGQAFTVSVSTNLHGLAKLNEKQQVSLDGPPTGGSFTLTFEGQTTAAIDYDAVAADVEAALEALSNIGSGNVAVTGDAPAWTVEFTGTFETTNVSLLTGNGSSLTGGAKVTLLPFQDGRASTGRIYRLTPLEATGTCFFWISIYRELYPGAPPGTGGYQNSFTGVVDINATATQMRGVFAASWGAANVNVTKDGRDFLVEFFLPGPQQITVASPAIMSIGIEREYSDEPQNEQQTLLLEHGPTGGTFTLTFRGQTTAGIAYNADAAAITSALEALSNIGSGDVEVTGSFPQFLIEFQGALEHTDHPLMTGSAAGLTGSSISVIATQEARAGVSEVQTVLIGVAPTGGTFKLTFSGQQTGAIAYNASAGTVQTALEGLSNIAGSGADISVSGPAGGPWLVTFIPGGAYEFTDVPTMIGDGALLTASAVGVTIANTVEPTGPEWADNPENWTLNLAPANGQTLVFQDSDRAMLYGLDMPLVTPAGIYFDATYTGDIGLPFDTGDYIEYRDRFWRIGADAGEMPIYIGRGEGTGSARINLDTGGCKVELHVEQTAPSGDGSPSVRWKGTDAANLIYADRGVLGIASDRDEVATVATLIMGYKDSPDGDATVVVGAGVTIGTIIKNGGTLGIECAIGTAFRQTVGETTIRGSGAVADLKIDGGVVNYQTSGTLNGNCEVGGDGVLDFAGDQRPKTVTNPIKVFGDEAEVNDPLCVVKTNGVDGDGFVVDYVRCTRHEQNGRNVRITRTVLA